MRIEFHQGVPEGCTEWLNKHVGKGNTTDIYDSADYAWFYRRERVYPQSHEVFDPREHFGPKYVPTITIKDPKLAVMFALRWSS
jgi:hypothetical protein